DAMAYWHQAAGLSFVQLTANKEPRILVRAADQTELNIAIGLGLVYRTYKNNRSQAGLVKVRSDYAACPKPCAELYRHELGHAMGIFGHVAGGALMAAPQTGIEASAREIAMLVELYRLPHGTHIEPDGRWSVVR